MPFIGFHPETQSSCTFDRERARLTGKVVEVKVLHENTKVCHVETLDGKLRVMFAKWPSQHWGKVRGVFKTKEQAQDYLDKPAPKFDADGGFLNKLSKSNLG